MATAMMKPGLFPHGERPREHLKGMVDILHRIMQPDEDQQSLRDLLPEVIANMSTVGSALRDLQVPVEACGCGEPAVRIARDKDQEIFFACDAAGCNSEAFQSYDPDCAEWPVAAKPGDQGQREDSDTDAALMPPPPSRKRSRSDDEGWDDDAGASSSEEPRDSLQSSEDSRSKGPNSSDDEDWKGA